MDFRTVLSHIKGERTLLAAGMHRKQDNLDLDTFDYLIERWLGKVEEPTIRDLDMEVDENILTLSGDELAYFAELVDIANTESELLHLTVDYGKVKVKVGDGGPWSLPIRPDSRGYRERTDG